MICLEVVVRFLLFVLLVEVVFRCSVVDCGLVSLFRSVGRGVEVVWCCCVLGGRCLFLFVSV